MARADFYVLSGQATPPRFSCTIAGKAVAQGSSVYILTGNREQAQAMDDLLWTFQDTSFLPHSLTDRDMDAPVLIGWEEPDLQKPDILINLTATVPGCAASFNRAIEIVGDDPEQRELGRNRYRQYRKLGFELFTHDIKPE